MKSSRIKNFSNYFLKEVEDITYSIEEATGLHRNDWLTKRTRERAPVVCRSIFSKMMRDKTNASLLDIGVMMDKDHSTVIHSLKNIKLWEEQANFYKEEVDLIAKSEINYKSIHEPKEGIHYDLAGNKWIKQNA